MTAEELLALPEDQGRGELVDGEFHAMNPSNYLHSRVTSRINFQIEQHASQNKLGATFVGDPGYILSRNPDTVLAPDVSFTSAARLPAQSAETFSEIMPDLVVEVISPSNSRKDVDDKTTRWLAAGVVVVWNVRPQYRTVSVHMAGGSIQNLNENDQLDGGDVLPGFTCRVSEFFP
jgi:Uma2 family endonuclease